MRIKKHLSGERAIKGPPAKRHLNGVLLAGPIFADICRGVFVLSSVIRLYTVIAIKISLKMSCADPETFVWRAE